MQEKNFPKLRGAVAEAGYSLTSFATEIGLTPQGLNEKIQGRSQFTLIEMIMSCNLLGKQIDIFFDPKLHNLQFLKSNKSA